MNWYKIAIENPENLYGEIKKYVPKENPTEEDIAYLSEDVREHARSQPIMREYHRRDHYRKNFGFSVPNQKAVMQIKQFVGGDTVLELGSGLGLWAKLLQDAGVKIIATDFIQERTKNWYKQPKEFTKIEDVRAEDAINKFPANIANILMIVWPPLESIWPYESLKSFKGNKLIYLGEFNAACAEDNFFEEIERNWSKVSSVQLDRQECLYDVLRLYERK